ncbi:MAG TPA: PadR family transcriptional regulator, partial [Syntrophomonas sp.]|nr:PadR family transcriptional regulator [Syntrophomonas sp.]
KKTEQTEGRPPRNIFSITPGGREEFVKWLMLPVEPHILRAELLLKLLFSNNIPVDNMVEKLENKIEEQMRIREYLDNGAEEIKSRIKTERKLKAWLAVIQWGKTITDATIGWCEETIQVLQEDDE